MSGPFCKHLIFSVFSLIALGLASASLEPELDHQLPELPYDRSYRRSPAEPLRPLTPHDNRQWSPLFGTHHTRRCLKAFVLCPPVGPAIIPMLLLPFFSSLPLTTVFAQQPVSQSFMCFLNLSISCAPAEPDALNFLKAH